MRKFTLLVLFSTLISGASFAQNDSRFTHYLFNQLFFNPAYAGLDAGGRFQYLGRSQWSGYSADGSGSPFTHLLSANVPLMRANAGIGGYFMYETVAATTALSFNVTPSYHFNVGNGKLSIGASLGFYSQGRDNSKYRPIDVNDRFIPASVNDGQFDLGAGIYYKSQKFFLGLSSTHITEPTFSFAGSASQAESGMNRHYYGVAGYNFELSPTITLTPSVLYKTILEDKGDQLEASLLATFNNKFWIGANYAQGEAGCALVGLSLLRDNSLKISYSIDIVAAGVEAKKPTSSEFMLAYTIPIVMKGPKPAVRTPRYRK